MDMTGGIVWQFLNKTLFNFLNVDVSFVALFKILVPTICFWFVGKWMAQFFEKRAAKAITFLGKSKKLVEIILRFIMLICGLSIGLKWSGFTGTIFSFMMSAFVHPLVTIGESSITLLSLILLVIVISASLFLAKYVINFLKNDIYPQSKIDPSGQNVINNITKYIIICLGVFIGLQINGIDLSALATMGAGLMVGVGLGLQSVASNFISGIILLFEKPIKVGDFVTVQNIEGVVDSIKGRSTLIRTRSNIIMIVPNSKFMDENVINWTHNDKKIWVSIPVGVSYNEDPEEVKKILLDIAHSYDFVLQNPEPLVYLNEFGDSSINMSLIICVANSYSKNYYISVINYEIFRQFKKYGISIPFPQLDVHHIKNSESISGQDVFNEQSLDN